MSTLYIVIAIKLYILSQEQKNRSWITILFYFLNNGIESCQLTLIGRPKYDFLFWQLNYLPVFSATLQYTWDFALPLLQYFGSKYTQRCISNELHSFLLVFLHSRFTKIKVMVSEKKKQLRMRPIMTKCFFCTLYV